MEEEVVFHVGAQVRCKDGPCGRLQSVVVDPITQRVTDLVVEKGLLLTTDRVLPVYTVEEADDEWITLSIGEDSLNNYPEYRDIVFEPAPADLEDDRYDPSQVLMWASAWDPYYNLPAVPLIQQHVHEGLSPEQAVIGRGTPVRNAEGRVGEIDHVLVNAETGEITYLVVDQGITRYSLVVPISMVKTVTEGGVLLEATDEELEQLHHYACPSDTELLADLRHILNDVASDLKDIGLAVRRGVARLTGVVPDVESRCRAEAAIRSSPDVIHVENALATDAAIRARVIAALAADPRTDIAIIDVTSDRAVVTLAGHVDSEEIRRAAEEIASQQPGVITVVNALEVVSDEHSQDLRFRLPVPPRSGKTASRQRDEPT